MNARELFERVRAERARWESVVASVHDDVWTEPGVCGAWSLRDVVSHVSWFEREMIGLIRTRRFEGSELWELACDERNDAIFRRNRDRSVAEVRAEAAELGDELLVQLATLRDEELEDPHGFPPMPPDWRPLDILAQNTFEHYAAHRESLERWLADRAQRDGG